MLALIKRKLIVVPVFPSPVFGFIAGQHFAQLVHIDEAQDVTDVQQAQALHAVIMMS